MNWIDQTLLEFGKTLGIDGLQFADGQLVRLDFERSGELSLEKGDSQVRVFLVRATRHLSGAQIGRALELCHWQNRNLFPIQSGLLGEQRIVFVATIRAENFVVPTLQKCFDYLCQLHETVADTPAETEYGSPQLLFSR